MGLARMIRHNFGFKVIALVSAVFLYAYVQLERNPIATRTLIAAVSMRGLAPGFEVEGPENQVEVAVTGPRQVVDRLKDGDVAVVGDLSSYQPASTTTALVRTRYVVQALPLDMARTLSFDPPVRTLKVQVSADVSRSALVLPHFPEQPPAGYRYDRATVTPARVRLRGRADRLIRVSQVLADAAPSEPGGAVDGDFPVSVRDDQNHVVEGVTVVPDTVHVKVDLVEEPQSKVVTISPLLSDLPLPPYRVTSVTVVPSQVRISGRPARLSQVFTLSTEDIPARAFQQDRTIQAFLQVPPGLDVRDLDGRPVTHVSVHVGVQREQQPTSPTGRDGAAPGRAP